VAGSRLQATNILEQTVCDAGKEKISKQRHFKSLALCFGFLRAFVKLLLLLLLLVALRTAMHASCTTYVRQPPLPGFAALRENDLHICSLAIGRVPLLSARSMCACKPSASKTYRPRTAQTALIPFAMAEPVHVLRVKERTRLHGVAGAGAAALIPARRRAEAVGRHAAYAIDGLSTSCTRFSSPGTADRSSIPTVSLYRSRSDVDQQVRLAHGRSWPKGSSCRFLPKLAS